MGFEVVYKYHPRKEDGSYDTSVKEDKSVKVGKPFDDTPLDSVAAAIMGQLARRDVWVIGVQVQELVRKDVSFKECKDGKGIMLGNRRYSFNEAAQMVSEDVVEESAVPPHLLLQQHSTIDELYMNPNRPVPTTRSNNNPAPAASAAPHHAPINPKKTMYRVIYNPTPSQMADVRARGYRLTNDKEYPVHAVIPGETIGQQQIAVTDDTGRVIKVMDEYFLRIGDGLIGGNFAPEGKVVKRNEPKLDWGGATYDDTLEIR